MTARELCAVAITVTVLAPAALLVVLAVSSVVVRAERERLASTLTRLAMILAFGSSCFGLGVYLVGDLPPQVFSFGSWFTLGEGKFEFDFLVDGISMGFMVLATGACGVVAAFSGRYLHREPGFTRYFVQLSMFALGITFVSLAGSIGVLFVGWELLGLSSALLVGFFHERRGPAVNALRVFAVYRASDAAMLSAAVLLHHWAGTGSLRLLFSQEAAVVLSSGQTLAIACLLILAGAGKCALLPFSGWLPRAMEGPTPSSAVYYGALSIHAGCLLLLRAEPLFAHSTYGRIVAASLGIATAIYATVVARVQTDVKSALAFASLTQVGIIVVEIALGLTTLALIHMTGHVSFRLLQFLSAPNVLHDLHELEGRLQERINEGTGGHRPGWYLFALERGFIDQLLERSVARPVRWLLQSLDRVDRILSTAGHDK